uniref:Mitochondrial carrier protein n=1 Tax=Heliothis virescens TaxID=7102 RepID=A0A2A4JR47_HELVI
MVGYNANDSMTQSEKLFAGCLSGVATRFITQPMDVIKIRSQLQRKPKRKNVVYRVARRIFWEEGVTAFWHGHVLGQFHSILAVSSQFYVYEITTKYVAGLAAHELRFNNIEHFICGVAAGCVCTTLVIPLEVIRVRQMLVKDQYKSVIRGAKAVYRYGGITAFYEGLSASLLQMGPQVGISFSVFNFVQPLILSLFAPCPPEECRGGNLHKPQNVMLASTVAGSAAGFVSKSMTYPFDLAKRRLQIGDVISIPGRAHHDTVVMVGYNANDSMTQSEKLFAGCLSGVATRFITQPMDVIKIRSQLQRKPKRKNVVYRVARRIFWEEGVTAFWHGHVLGQFHSILAVSSQFYVYEITTKYVAGLAAHELRFNNIEHFICGVAAGCVCTTLVIPLEVIRVRQMLVKDQYKSVIRGAKAVYRYGGITAFYEGLSASLLQMGPQVGISFSVFNFVQPLILSLFAPCPPEECRGGNLHKPQNVMLASTVAGSAAGFVSKSMTYPFDLAKRRLQIGSHRTSQKYKTPTQSQKLIRCTKLLQCLFLAYKYEGLKGLFRGWTVTVYKAQMTSVVAFTTYELICFTTREFNTLATL